MPVSKRIVEVFPEPLGPMKPKISPCFTSKVRFSTMTLSPICLVTFRTSIILGLPECAGEAPPAGAVGMAGVGLIPAWVATGGRASDAILIAFRLFVFEDGFLAVSGKITQRAGERYSLRCSLLDELHWNYPVVSLDGIR